MQNVQLLFGEYYEERSQTVDGFWNSVSSSASVICSNAHTTRFQMENWHYNSQATAWSIATSSGLFIYCCKLAKLEIIWTEAVRRSNNTKFEFIFASSSCSTIFVGWITWKVWAEDKFDECDDGNRKPNKNYYVFSCTRIYRKPSMLIHKRHRSDLTNLSQLHSVSIARLFDQFSSIIFFFFLLTQF